MSDMMWSGIESLDILRIKAATSGTGCIQVSIEALNDVKVETDWLKAERDALRKHLRNMVCLIEEYTDLPLSAANGVGYMGIDEGVSRTDEIINNAKLTLPERRKGRE